MSMNKYQRLVFVFLLLSGLLGVYILVEDAVVGPPTRLLWADNWVWAPIPHATGLVVMVVIDFILAGMVALRPSSSVKPALAWGVLQFLVMALNPFTGSFYVEAIMRAAEQSPELIVPAEFRQFLLGMSEADRRVFLEGVFSPQSFAAYLFGIPGYVARFVTEILLIISSITALRAK